MIHPKFPSECLLIFIWKDVSLSMHSALFTGNKCFEVYLLLLYRWRNSIVFCGKSKIGEGNRAGSRGCLVWLQPKMVYSHAIYKAFYFQGLHRSRRACKSHFSFSFFFSFKSLALYFKVFILLIANFQGCICLWNYSGRQFCVAHYSGHVWLYTRWSSLRALQETRLYCFSFRERVRWLQNDSELRRENLRTDQRRRNGKIYSPFPIICFKSGTFTMIWT